MQTEQRKCGRAPGSHRHSALNASNPAARYTGRYSCMAMSRHCWEQNCSCMLVSAASPIKRPGALLTLQESSGRWPRHLWHTWGSSDGISNDSAGHHRDSSKFEYQRTCRALCKLQQPPGKGGTIQGREKTLTSRPHVAGAHAADFLACNKPHDMSCAKLFVDAVRGHCVDRDRVRLVKQRK